MECRGVNPDGASEQKAGAGVGAVQFWDGDDGTVWADPSAQGVFGSPMQTSELGQRDLVLILKMRADDVIALPHNSLIYIGHFNPQFLGCLSSAVSTFWDFCASTCGNIM